MYYFNKVIKKIAIRGQMHEFILKNREFSAYRYFREKSSIN